MCKISLNVNKKLGLPEFGSCGASCAIDFEIDSATLTDRPDEFTRRVQAAYRLCRESVEAELAEHRPNGTAKQDNRPTPPPSTEYRNSSPPERSNENRFPVSDKQLKFISQLTKAVKGLNARKLDEYCQVTYGNTCNNLSSKDASKLIDDLKQAKEQGGL